MTPLTRCYVVAPDLTCKMFESWCNLKGYEPARTPLALLIDDATGLWERRMEEFSDFVQDVVWDRLLVAPTEGGGEC